MTSKLLLATLFLGILCDLCAPCSARASVAPFFRRVGGSVANPQDARKWAEALANWQRYSGSKDAFERALAIQDLGHATSEKHDKQCWGLVQGTLRQELSKEGKDGKNEEKISGEVLEACVEALRRVAQKDAVADMTKVAKNKAESIRLRMYVIWGLGGNGPLKDLAELADDKSPHLQIAAVDSLVLRAEKDSADLFLRILKDPARPWEVKFGALQGIDKTADEKSIEPLIDGLGRCRDDEGRLKDEYIRILQRLVGYPLKSEDPNLWRSTWTAKKEGKDPSKLPQGSTVADPTEFYGLTTRSTRVVFVLDRTGSMSDPGSEPEKNAEDEKKKPVQVTGNPKEPLQETLAREEAARILKKHNDRKATTRMEVAKKELINTIYNLDPRVHFNVIWYEGNPTPWRQELVPALWVNKLDCIKDADKLHPSGPTNIWDALEIAFKMTEAPQRPDLIQIDKKANYATALNGADTFFLMTDGKPNEGRIFRPEDILAELKKVNRLRRVTIHAICIGDAPTKKNELVSDPPDPDFLKKMAHENGGDFTHIKK